LRQVEGAARASDRERRLRSENRKVVDRVGSMFIKKIAV